jgi:hypothetical protein
MSDLEMQITNQSLPVIQFNFDDIKTKLQATVSQYSGLIVTDDTLSVCKAKQGELASLRTKIDKYRLEKKKELLVPIDEFEGKCKELIKLVENAEKPLKEGIAVFDNMKRETKRQEAIGAIAESVAAHGLTEKYAKQITVIDKYMNLTAKTSDVKEDVEQRVFLLLSEQKKEQEMLEIIQDTIDNENKTVKTPLNMSQFQKMIDMGMSTKDVLNEIKKRAEQIREAEKPKPVIVPVEIPVEAPKPETYDGNHTYMGVYMPSAAVSPEIIPEEPEMWFAELRFVDTKAKIIALKGILAINGYTYKALNQGKIE